MSTCPTHGSWHLVINNDTTGEEKKLLSSRRSYMYISLHSFTYVSLKCLYFIDSYCIHKFVNLQYVFRCLYSSNIMEVGLSSTACLYTLSRDLFPTNLFLLNLCISNM